MSKPLDLFEAPQKTKRAEPVEKTPPARAEVPREQRATVTVEMVNRGGMRGRWSVDWDKPPTVQPDGTDGADRASFEARAALNYMLQTAYDKIALVREDEAKK